MPRRQEYLFLITALALMVIAVSEMKYGWIGKSLKPKPVGADTSEYNLMRGGTDTLMSTVTKLVKRLPKKQEVRKDQLEDEFSKTSRNAKGSSTCHPRNMDSIQSDVKKQVQLLSDKKAKFDDPELLKVIREAFIDYPGSSEINVSKPVFKTTQAAAADRLLKQKTNGFFVECGANDGMYTSNSLFFETERQWTGILIEMDPKPYSQLCYKHRNAYSLNVCLSTKTYPIIARFVPQDDKGLLKDKETQRIDGEKLPKIPTSICFPLQSIMFALKRTKIDYFSLDVEGQELNVLETIPFDVLDISVISVEFLHVPNQKKIVPYMSSNGYDLNATLTKLKPHFCHDYIFVKKGIYSD